jgi:hypothetical protein
MSAVTEIPGLLRKGTPLIVTIEGHAPVSGLYVGPDTVDEAKRHGPHLVGPVDPWPDYGFDAAWMTRSCTDAEIDLDWSDPTARAHAAWAVTPKHNATAQAWNTPEACQGKSSATLVEEYDALKATGELLHKAAWAKDLDVALFRATILAFARSFARNATTP